MTKQHDFAILVQKINKLLIMLHNRLWNNFHNFSRLYTQTECRVDIFSIYFRLSIEIKL